jgi:hypothetical protein
VKLIGSKECISMRAKSLKPKFDVRPRQYKSLNCEVREDLLSVLSDYAAALGEHKKAVVKPEDVLESMLEDLAAEPFLIAYRAAKAEEGKPKAARKGASSEASKEAKKPQTQAADEAR